MTLSVWRIGHASEDSQGKCFRTAKIAEIDWLIDYILLFVFEMLSSVLTWLWQLLGIFEFVTNWGGFVELIGVAL
jgi:hypothetical protein